MDTEKDIVFATANARYAHTSLSLRCLVANLGDLAHRSRIQEFSISDDAAQMAEALLASSPKVVLLSVYLWNTALLTEVAEIIRKVRPAAVLVVGGPEVSFETDEQRIAQIADHVVQGEAEAALPGLLEQILSGTSGIPKVLKAEPPNLDGVSLPYDLYSEEDIAHRVIYVEASRGCPFGCEFCLSSLDRAVRRFPKAALLGAIDGLWARGARRFKFLDRALHLAIWPALLDYFAAKGDPSCSLHFELVPDRLPAELLEGLKPFSPGAVQLEAGLQTLNDEVSARIGRRQNIEKALRNLARLRTETGAHLHADLVVGLPGETVESFAAGFDRLMTLGLQEIQVGILKRLRGAPIRRHDDEWGMVYRSSPPYDILQNRTIGFTTMQRLKRFSKHFDRICNRGHFISFQPLIWENRSPFEALMDLSDWLYRETGRVHSVSLSRTAELLFVWATKKRGMDPGVVASRLFADLSLRGRRGIPAVIAEHGRGETRKGGDDGVVSLLPRQQRHVERR